MEEAHQRLVASNHMDQHAANVLREYLDYRQHATLGDAYKFFLENFAQLHTDRPEALEDTRPDFSLARTAQDIRSIARRAAIVAHHRRTLPGRKLPDAQPSGLHAFSDLNSLRTARVPLETGAHCKLIVDRTSDSVWHICFAQLYEAGRPLGSIVDSFEILASRIHAYLSGMQDSGQGSRPAVRCHWYLYTRAAMAPPREEPSCERFCQVESGFEDGLVRGDGGKARKRLPHAYPSVPPTFRQLLAANVFIEDGD